MDRGEFREILWEIVEDGRRAAAVIDRLRALLEKGDPQLTVLDLNETVAEVVRLIRSDALVRDISIRLELDPTLSPARGDRVQLQQVLLNLALNGMDAMQELRRGERTLAFRTGMDRPGGIRVSVRGSGVGIRGRDVEPMFQPFFDILLHAARQRGRAMTARTASLVFIVDDDASVRKSLTRLVRAAAYITSRRSPRRATSSLAPATTAFLPGSRRADARTDGVGLAGGTCNSGQRLPIVFITGHPDVWAQVKAMKGGAIDFLSKPVNDQDLLDAIERAVTKTRRAHHDETRITEIQNRIETVTQAGGAGNGSD